MTRGPRIARVHITTSDNAAVTPGTYRDLAQADAMLARAFTLVPAPLGRPYHRLGFTIVWTDGYELTDAVLLSDALVREGLRRGGILRHLLWRGARAAASHQLGEADRERGAELLQRLAASVEPDTAIDDRRNSRGDSWSGPTLLPDPVAAIAEMPMILVVPKGSPIDSVQSLVAAARSRSGGLAYASQGPGSSASAASSAALDASACGSDAAFMRPTPAAAARGSSVSRPGSPPPAPRGRRGALPPAARRRNVGPPRRGYPWPGWSSRR